VNFGRLSAWRSKAAVNRFARRTFEVFGILWLLIEPLALWKPENVKWGVNGYAWLTALSVVVALVWAWPKTSITHRIGLSDTAISVRLGNVFDQTGNIIVGVTDVFDTEVGNVIAPASVQGQFQLRYFPNQHELDRLIDQSLAAKSFEIDQEKETGKNKRYPLGTVAHIEHGAQRFILLAYSRMSRAGQAQSDICKLTTSLQACWQFLRESGQHQPVHMPVIGSRYARTGFPRSLLIQLIVLSFLDEERRGNLTNQLTIYVAEADAETVDFAMMDDWLLGLMRAT
jgi:hypothetical protein